MKSLQYILEAVRAKNIISKKTGPEGAKEDIAYVIDHATDVAGEKWFGYPYIMTLAVEIHYIFQHYGIKPKDYKNVIPVGEDYQDYIELDDNFKWVERLYKKNESSKDKYESYFKQLYNGHVPKSRDLNKIFDPESSTWKVPLVRKIDLDYIEKKKLFIEDIAFLAQNIDEIYDKYYKNSGFEMWQMIDLEIGVGCWRYDIARYSFNKGIHLDDKTYRILNNYNAFAQDWPGIQNLVYKNYNKSKSKRIKSFLEEAYIAQGKIRVDLKTQYAGKIGVPKPKPTTPQININDINNLSDKQLLKKLGIPDYESYHIRSKKGREYYRKKALVSDDKKFMNELRRCISKYGQPLKISKASPYETIDFDPGYSYAYAANNELEWEGYSGNCVSVTFKNNNIIFSITSTVRIPNEYDEYKKYS